MDHHTLAAVSIAGISFDVLGGLYLAYDLLGGKHGPLRLLTRMVTYSIVFGAGFSLGMGLFFGVVCGAATGVTIAIELHRTAISNDHYSLPWETLFSAIRGAAFAAGLYWMVGLRFAVIFGIFVTAGQVVAYARGIRPSIDYIAARHARLTARQLWAALIRTLAYIVTALLCSAFVRHIDHPWLFALRVGLVTGIATVIGIAVNPYIEYYADNLPSRRLGAFGIALVFLGFALQSVQYCLVLFDVPVA